MEKYVSTWDSALEKSRSHYIENVDDIHREARRITLDYVVRTIKITIFHEQLNHSLLRFKFIELELLRIP